MPLLSIDEFRVVENDRAPSNEIDFVTGPDPWDPARIAIFARNLNVNRGIRVAIRVESDVGLMITLPDRSISRSRWPLRFETRVPPGSQVYVGRPQFPVWRSILSSSDAAPIVAKDIATQSYFVEGAVYENLPFPPENDVPSDFLWLYSVPMYGTGAERIADMFVNLHSHRSLKLSATAVPDQTSFQLGVEAGFEFGVFASSEIQRYVVRSLVFV